MPLDAGLITNSRLDRPASVRLPPTPGGNQYQVVFEADLATRHKAIKSMIVAPGIDARHASYLGRRMQRN